MQVKQYLRFLAQQRKLQHFFSNGVLSYSIALLALMVLSLVTYSSAESVDYWALLIFGAFFVLVNAGLLAGLLTAQFSASHNEYVLFLGFTRTQLRHLMRVASLPVTVTAALFFFIAITGDFSILPRLGLTVLFILLGDLLCTAFLSLINRWGSASQKPRAQARGHKTTFRAFKTPRRAFFSKDFHVVSKPGMIIAGASFLVAIIFVTIFASLVFYWQVFAGCLLVVVYSGVLAVSGQYGDEVAAYHYYRYHLRLTDRQIIAYKMPLTLLCIIVPACLFTLCVGLIASFEIWQFILLPIIIGFMALLCYSLNWWYVDALREERTTHLLHELTSLLFSILPILAPLYLMGSRLTLLIVKSSRKKRTRHA